MSGTDAINCNITTLLVKEIQIIDGDQKKITSHYERSIHTQKKNMARIVILRCLVITDFTNCSKLTNDLVFGIKQIISLQMM